jgi:sulfur relay (sulfurtransferase) DsrC/TusE family protein
MYRDNESFMIWTEARLLAVRDARFRTKLNALMTEKRAQIADFIRYFYERVGVAPTVPPEQMAMGFMSLAEGVKLYMMSSPAEMTGPIAESLLTVFVDSIMRLARLEADSSKRE